MERQLGTITDLLKDALSRDYVTEDGDPYRIEAGPPLSLTEISSLEAQAGAPLPADLVEVLGFCSGLTGPLAEPIDFTGQLLGQELPDDTSRVLHIALDGFGNSWAIDLAGHREERSHVWFSCHDAPVLLVQSHSLADFITELAALGRQGEESKINLVHDDRIFRVWQSNPGLISYEQALASGDAVIAGFARDHLDATFAICDLREAPVGMGFAWGRHGPQTIVQRAGPERVFATAPKPRTGFMKKLFG